MVKLSGFETGRHDISRQPGSFGVLQAVRIKAVIMTKNFIMIGSHLKQDSLNECAFYDGESVFSLPVQTEQVRNEDYYAEVKTRDFDMATPLHYKRYTLRWIRQVLALNEAMQKRRASVPGDNLLHQIVVTGRKNS